MLIVDAQVHTWAASTPERPWSGGGEPQRPTPFSNEDLLEEMNAAGVHRAVLVPPGWEGSRNDLALAAARAHPHRFAVMGRIPPQLLSKSQGALIGWRKQPGMLGLRLAMNTSVRYTPTSARLMTRLARSVCSGARTYRARRFHTGSM